jgi:hypothetical protein
VRRGAAVVVRAGTRDPAVPATRAPFTALTSLPAGQHHLDDMLSGMGIAGAVLIRPDGHVAWAAGPNGSAHGRWFARPGGRSKRVRRPGFRGS